MQYMMERKPNEKQGEQYFFSYKNLFHTILLIGRQHNDFLNRDFIHHGKKIVQMLSTLALIPTIHTKSFSPCIVRKNCSLQRQGHIPFLSQEHQKGNWHGLESE
uniref:Uncharacterized protein n=1 Tax=Micrurus surinamensis TaxID=129470 RepID=A0A2D4NNG0_MICSU